MALNTPVPAATPPAPRPAPGPRGHFLLGSILDFKRDILLPGHRVRNHATITLRPRYGMLMTIHPRHAGRGDGASPA